MSIQELYKSAQLVGVALLLGAGLAYLFLWAEPVARGRIRLLALLGALLCTGGALAELRRLSLGLATGALALPFSEALSLIALQTSVGRLLLLRAGIALAMLFSFQRIGRWLLPVFGVGLTLCFALAGHAAAETTGRALSVTADGLHLLGAGLWFGGLVALVLLPWSALGVDRLRGLLARFSALGLGTMATLAVTGLLLSARRLYGPIALVEQPYGRVLLLKLAFVGAVLTVAAGSFWLTRSLKNAQSVPRLGLLRLCMGAESILGLAVLAVVGVLTVTPTPRGEPYRVSVTLTDQGFAPATITVPAHQPVLLRVTNEGSEEHSFVVFGVPHEMIERNHNHGPDSMVTFVRPGEQEQIQFVARKPGLYPIYCMIEGHTEAPSPYEGSLVFLEVR